MDNIFKKNDISSPQCHASVWTSKIFTTLNKGFPKNQDNLIV